LQVKKKRDGEPTRLPAQFLKLFYYEKESGQRYLAKRPASMISNIKNHDFGHLLLFP